jgi:hypothetical protein
MLNTSFGLIGLLNMLLMKCKMLNYLLVLHISRIFNINLEADSHEKRKLLDILDIFSLSMIPMASTYHQPHCHASTIDMILFSILEILRSTTQFGCPGISHHEFFGASFEISHYTSANDVHSKIV